MPDRRKHRGPAPLDPRLFAAEKLPALRRAVAEFAWLLSHGYAESATLKLVGDRHNLESRQRDAVRRSTCADSAVADRRARELSLKDCVGRRLAIDGFNLIISIESALSGAVLLRGREGSVRDLGSVHGSYRKVEETLAALDCIANTLAPAEFAKVTWYLDRPVSNSGRLAGILRERWDVELVNDPDRVLVDTDDVVVSSDAFVLDGCGPWLNLAAIVIAELPNAWMLELWKELA
jgi:hypothetical protein